MAYRNQYYGNQNVNTMRGMMSQRSASFAAAGGSCTQLKDNEACSPVIVNDERECMADKTMTAGDKALTLADLPLAMAYVPWQKFHNLFNEMEAFKNGTIFKELDLEFYRKGCR